MSDQQVRVVFEPQGRAVHVLPGTKVIEAAARAGLTIDTPCGGAGLCGKCRVQITRGANEPLEQERRAYRPEELAEGWRLACQSQVTQAAVVQIPETSIFASQQQILVESKTDHAQEILPGVRKIYVEMPLPTLEEGQADLLRLEKQVGPFRADLATLRHVGGLISRLGYKGTAVLADHRLIDFESGDTTAACYGVAFDIGTTTLVGSLMDLRTGRELAISPAMNPQVAFGDDVLSRINHAQTKEGLEDLRASIIQTVGAMVRDLATQAGVRAENIYEVTFSGNTTMQHLLCGIDVSQLGQSPFVSPCGRGLLLGASDLGLAIHPQAAAYIFPVIGGFVGGDTVAGMVSTRLLEQDGACLMVDIGTNGEIVLAVGGELWAASTAAGPAFEGARIHCGMRAAAGAIEKVVLDGDVQCGVIGNADPIGICGSGLIDLAAEMLRVGILSSEGRLLDADELPPTISPALRQRVRQGANGQPEFLLADGSDSNKPVVVLTQRDIRELQLSSGAIRAGIAILLKQAGLRTSDLNLVLMAGGFGSFIRRNHAQRIGLLPADIEHRKIHYVGNTSLSGARWALLSTKSREQAERLARKTHHVELSQDMDFQMHFAEAMIFPEQ